LSRAAISGSIFDKNTGLIRKAEFLALRLFCGLLRMLPLGVVRACARRLGDFTFYVLRVRRLVAERNLRAAFPEKSDRWIRSTARQSQQNLFIAFMEFLYSEKLSIADLRRHFTVVNPEIVEAALNRRRGILFMTGHFGSWELNAVFVMADLGRSAVIIVKKQRNHYVDRYINQLRTRLTNRIVYMKESVREILKTLRDRGIVALIADQSAPRDSVFVPFFGREVTTFAGPAHFALQTGASILMGFPIRTGDGNYRVVFEEVPTGDLSEPTRENIRILTARHTAVLEKYIREYPGQWLWQHRRWKHVRPLTGSPPLNERKASE
jgi:Kdo2-lipid IVA lauroyltransferase/acyltransferase